MPSNATGKTIASIKVLKTKVVVYFSKKDKLEISKDTYSSYYLFKDKFLTNKEIKEIKEADDMNKYLEVGLNAIKKGLITEGKLKSKLYDKGAHKTIVEKVLKIMKGNDLINDEGYILDYIEYANEKLYGHKKISENLIARGIDIEKAHKIKISPTVELKKAKKLVALLEKNYQRYSYPIKKQKIYNALLSKGYDLEIALKAITSIKPDKDDKLLEKELNVAVSHWMRANSDKYEQDKDRFNALYAYLKRKGYSYNKIKQSWEEYYEFIN